jgi:hypothetical protein
MHPLEAALKLINALAVVYVILLLSNILKPFVMRATWPLN